MDIAPASLTVGILAGGKGRRLGGIDKGWYDFDGAPLIEHTLARVRGQAARVIVSANRSLARYRALGYPVCSDDGDDWRGPLAGVAAVLRAAVTPYVLVVPVDTPRLPRDLAARLAKPMQSHTQIAIAHAGGRAQPLHALMRHDVRDDLETALFAGIRVVQEWQARLDRVAVEFAHAAPFMNINAKEDARAALDRG